jgi:membrane fusion protein, heavy metal efflux system
MNDLNAKLSRASLLLMIALFGCQNPQEPAEKQTPSEPEASVDLALPQSVEVDPGLLRSGALTLAPVLAAQGSQGSVIYGEVVPPPSGLAEVGALVSGRIASLEATEGAVVKKGQTLAWLDAPEVGMARASLEQSLAQLELAERRVERQRKLVEAAATSSSAVEEAEAQFRLAVAERDSALVRLRSLGAETSSKDGRLAIRTPIAGVITARNAILGAAVASNQTLFVVTAIDELMIEARFPEAQGALPQEGTRYLARPRTGHQEAKRPCTFSVHNSLAHVDASTRSTVVRLKPVEPCVQLRPGLFVELLREGKTDPAHAEGKLESGAGLVQVPSLAVVDLRNQPSVFLATDRPGVFRVQAVTPLGTSGSFTIVGAGVSEGQSVAMTGVFLLKGEVLKAVLGGE